MSLGNWESYKLSENSLEGRRGEINLSRENSNKTAIKN
jgi:hypothetical protein